jgi:hypothetical protein
MVLLAAVAGVNTGHAAQAVQTSATHQQQQTDVSVATAEAAVSIAAGGGGGEEMTAGSLDQAAGPSTPARHPSSSTGSSAGPLLQHRGNAARAAAGVEGAQEVQDHQQQQQQ